MQNLLIQPNPFLILEGFFNYFFGLIHIIPYRIEIFQVQEVGDQDGELEASENNGDDAQDHAARVDGDAAAAATHLDWPPVETIVVERKTTMLIGWKTTLQNLGEMYWLHSFPQEFKNIWTSEPWRYLQFAP